MSSLSTLWISLTALGETGFAVALLPLLVAGNRHNGRFLYSWMPVLWMGAFIVLSTKIAYMGWHIGIPFLRFTGLSGHAFLAAALLPLGLSFLWPRKALLLGLSLAALVALSRVILGAHSPSEALLGWLLGAVVSGVGLSHFQGSHKAPPVLLWAPLLLIALALCFPPLFSWIPSYRWELETAHWLSHL